MINRINGTPRLDDAKRREILAILSVGCSRRTAARFVGCSAKAIQEAADRDPDFAQRLRRAEHKAEVGCLKNVQQAAGQDKHWRASVWALERLNPEDFAPRKPEAMTLERFNAMMAQLADALVADIPVARYRKAVLRRLDRLMAELRAGRPEEG